MTSNIGNPDVTPSPPIHNVPAVDSPGGSLNPAEIVAEGNFLLDSIIGAVAIALGNVSVLGVKPLAFLTAWGENLETQAALALANANSVQTAQQVGIDATTSGSVHTGSPTGYTLPHTCAPPPNTELIVDVNITPLTPGTYAGGTTVTYAGVQMISGIPPTLGYVNIGDGTDGWIERFHLDNPTGGLNNIVVTAPYAVQSIIVSAESYTGCSGVSGLVSAATNATSQGITVQTVANGMASFAFASAGGINSALAGATVRTLQNTSAGNMAVGDAPGGAAVTVTAQSHLEAGTPAVIPVGTGTGVFGATKGAAESVTPTAAAAGVVATSGTGALTVTPTAADTGGLGSPTYDNSAYSSLYTSLSSPASMSSTQTVGGSGNAYGLVAAIISNGGSQAFIPSTATVTFGGVTLTSLGSVLMDNFSNAGFIWLFGGENIPSGPQSISATLTDAGQQFAFGYLLSATYTGVSSVGTLQTSYGAGTQPTLSVSSAVNQLVFGIIATYEAMTYSGLSLTQRQYESTLPPAFIAGDTAGASTVTVSATQSNDAFPWAVAGLNLT